MKYKNLGNAVEFIGESGCVYVVGHGDTVDFTDQDHTAVASLKTWENIPTEKPTPSKKADK